MFAHGVSGLLCRHLQHPSLFSVRRLRGPENGIHQQLTELRIFEVVGMAEGSVKDAGLLEVAHIERHVGNPENARTLDFLRRAKARQK